MNALAQFSTTALLGTERRPPRWPERDDKVGELLAKMSREQTEEALLQTVGVLATCQLAGWLPPVINDALKVVGAQETLKHDLPATHCDSLANILADGPLRLQAEAFQKLAAAGCGVPFRLLPKALECGRRCTALRSFLLRVIGQRGGWLAEQNDAWSFAIGGGADELDSEIWEHGSLDQRKLFLTTMRKQDAPKARELVTAALTNEGARERAAFVECLATALSVDDEELLEFTLRDKSKEARQTAVRLLSSLVGSRFMQRMSARLEPCLVLEKKFLRGTVVKLEPPAAFPREWNCDLIEEAKPQGRNMGERAWWLLQIVRATPLIWWEEHTSLKPAELIEWAQKSDWNDALLQGWAAAQGLQHRVEWAEAFLTTPLPAGVALNTTELLETLPLAVREKHFLRMWQAGEGGGAFSGAFLSWFLATIPFDAPSLAPDFAKQTLRHLKQRINSGEARHDWQLRASLVEFACLVPPALFEECATGWDITKEAVQPFVEAVARLGIVLDHRRQLHLLNT